ncbi:alpha-galactosidase [Auraticoccus monumenti]|uniref:Alpha-galactosidase n=2 Tax=Auraticoccus monumenti TaxID=675864 RepID=A0A1G6WWY2_9ACTN|nr:alpha-galactosidase [Auraticoccus monumenti]
MPLPSPLRVHLRSAGVSLVVEVPVRGLPVVLHWGDDLGALDAATASTLSLARVAQPMPNQVDEPVRVAVLPEHHTGWVGRPGISGSRAGTAWTPLFTVTGATLDGQELGEWREQGPGSLAVEAVDEDAGLALRLELELSAAGLVRARAALTNTAPEAYQLDDLVLSLPVPQRARELLDLAGRWGKERTPQRRELQVGTHLREGRHGRTGPDAATVLHLGVPGFGFAEGEVWGVHTGWSGNHTHYAERVFTGEQLVGGGELLLPGEVRLGTGETYTSSWLHGSHGHGLDAVARRFHRELRARPQHPRRPRPVTLNVWEAVYFDHDLDRLRDLADRAARLGVERFVLDDGWFGARRDDSAGLGDWVVSPDVWPDGLHPLVDHVRGLGMEFGLWFEPEMVNLDSDLARAHPEWVLAPGKRLPVTSRRQHVLDLTDEGCWTHVRDQMTAVLSEYPIAYVKWDHNRDLVEAAHRGTGRPAVHEQTLATYRLMADLKQRHPGLEIESCSSGGLRIDLGVLQHTDRVWVSDCIDPFERRQIQRWTTQLVPPELMGTHVASGRNHTTGRVHDLSFRAGTAFFGHLGLEWDLARATEQELAELTAWIAAHKEHRSLLHSGDLVRADFPDATVELHGVVAPDGSRALYQLASVGRSEVSLPGALLLPGLDAARRYRVTPRLVGGPPHGLVRPAWWPADGEEGPVLPGAVLTRAGLQAPGLLPEQAVLVEVTATA